MKSKILHPFLLGLASTAIAVTAYGESVFRAEVELRLCPEHAVGGTAIQIAYTTPASIQKVFPPTTQLSIDALRKTGKFRIELPANGGTTPLRVFALCQNALGTSAPSNVLEISYCDALTSRDSDSDTISDRLEDSNCNQHFDSGDSSHFSLQDSDNDGVSDLNEGSTGSLAWNYASSPAPRLLPSPALDTDNDGNSDLIAYRPATNFWYFRSAATAQETPFGTGDGVPFLYQVDGAAPRVGYVEVDGEGAVWHFSQSGLRDVHDLDRTQVAFGNFGDILLPGAWISAGNTTPAIARFDGRWHFSVYRSEGEHTDSEIASTGSPYPLDRDGDGIVEAAVLRLSDSKLIVDAAVEDVVIDLGLGAPNAIPIAAQDLDGDNKDDVIVWDSLNRRALIARSSHNYALVETLNFAGAPVDVVPLPTTIRAHARVMSVGSPSTGVRYYFPGNDDSQEMVSEQWGAAGDVLG